MSKRDDVKKYYDISKCFQSIVDFLFILNFGATFLSLFISGSFFTFLVIIQIVATFFNLVLSWMNDNLLFQCAEEKRRKVLIASSFGMNTTIDKEVGYYNNELKPSTDKLILNSFESVFFTKNIIKKMFFCEIIKFLIAIAIFLGAFVLFSDGDLLLLAFQTIFSSSYIFGFLTFLVYYSKINSLYENFYKILITGSVNTKETNIQLLVLVTEYEIIKSAYRVQPSTKIFNRLNPTLSDKWEELNKQTIFSKHVR